jgi:hypothetical protein
MKREKWTVLLNKGRYVCVRERRAHWDHGIKKQRRKEHKT